MYATSTIQDGKNAQGFRECIYCREILISCNFRTLASKRIRVIPSNIMSVAANQVTETMREKDRTKMSIDDFLESSIVKQTRSKKSLQNFALRCKMAIGPARSRSHNSICSSLSVQHCLINNLVVSRELAGHRELSKHRVT